MHKFEVKKKFINHLIKNGEKKTSEKLLLQSLKELQKETTKQPKTLIKLALANSTPIFKLHKIENKKQRKKNRKVKEIPSFLSSQKARVSLAIKFIIKVTKKKKTKRCFEKLNKEILLNINNTGEASLIKNDLQKQVLLNKRYFQFYKWK
jgi:small subunit ribosomal protein S7